jgi:hypothetical protein
MHTEDNVGQILVEATRTLRWRVQERRPLPTARESMSPWIQELGVSGKTPRDRAD